MHFMPGATWSRTISALSASLLLTLLATTARAQIRLDLPVQPMGQSLTAIGTLGHLNVMFDPSVVDGLQAPALKAELSADDALSRLLSGTRLHAVRVDANTIRVLAETPANRVQSIGEGTQTGAMYAPTNVHLAYAYRLEQSQGPLTDSAEATAPDNKSPESAVLEQVVVTGTHIRGATSTASPVHVYTRDVIDRSGAGSVKDFVSKLPENFGGVASEDTIQGHAGGNGSGDNFVSGTAINLRGLGPDSTLVLIDGRRVAPGNTLGNWVDISMIPLSAIDRIEVVPDGASAIYGSDAVGGVVNIIMRKSFEGFETRVRYGSSTEAAPHEVDLGQTGGYSWTTGSAIASYEYSDRTNVTATERSYTSTQPGPFDLLPSQRRQSVYGHIDQSLTNSIGLFASGIYSHKSSTSDQTFANALSQSLVAKVDNYSIAAGGRADLGKGFEFTLSSSYAASDTQNPTITLPSGAPISNLTVDTRLRSVDAQFDGPLAQLPSGLLLFAFGGQYRGETFSQVGLVARTSFDVDRSVYAGFAELNVPIVGPGGQDPAINRMELTVADRFENYSDFGSTNNPKLGLAWRPFRSVTLRGTYGTSFRAPILSQLNPTPTSVVALQVPDSTTGQLANVVTAAGGNPTLKPEKAHSWSAGLDFTPESIPGFHTHLNYYNIRFDERVAAIYQAGVTLPLALTESATLGSAIVRRNPTVSFLQSLVANGPTFIDLINCKCVANPATFNFSQIGVFIDNRFANLSKVDTDGLDFGVSYTTDTGLGKLESGVDGTYIVALKQQVLPTTPTQEIVSTPYNPVNVKLRFHSVFQAGGLAIAAYINYVNSYTDSRGAIPVSVASWTTLDFSIGYGFAADAGLLRNTSLLLSAVNVTNRAPPYVFGDDPTTPGINYDGTNANTLGRQVSLQISKRF